MNALGKTATLRVIKTVTNGFYLDGENLGEVFLPKREAPAGTQVGHTVDVFVYRDSETVLHASTSRPTAELGQCAFMKVVAVTAAGAFVEWGLPKDLFVPTQEQYTPLETGRSYVVRVYLDERTNRLAGSVKLPSFLSENGSAFTPGEEVGLLVCGSSDLGYKAVINHTHVGLIHRDDAPHVLQYGQKLKGYIKYIRTDQKIDLSLLPPGRSGRELLAERILGYLDAHGGTMRLTDKSPAEEIGAAFGVSKSSFKKAVGVLYKQRKIHIGAEKIVRTEDTPPPQKS